MATHRSALALLTCALTAPLLSAPALAWPPGDTPVPAVQSIAELCAKVADTGFSDVPATHVFAQAIGCVSAAGISHGGPDGRPTTEYGPELTVQRGAMASFVARAMDAADRLDTGDAIQALPAVDPGAAPFRDVPADYVHAESIQRLASARIVLGGVGGGPSDLYWPDNPVLRAQMATFLNKAFAFLLGEEPADAGTSTGLLASEADYYIDDEAIETVHAVNITAITGAGIAVGDGDQRYNPTMVINRGQMAGFLSRTLAELYDRGLIHEVDAEHDG